MFYILRSLPFVIAVSWCCHAFDPFVGTWKKGVSASNADLNKPKIYLVLSLNYFLSNILNQCDINLPYTHHNEVLNLNCGLVYKLATKRKGHDCNK